jgi:HAD superfamily hydrolase (TIGR01509 family)
VTRCIVLDAMGVIFRAADDVAELLIPFVARNGGTADATIVAAAYIDASLGRIDADAFWQRVGLDAGVEDAYLATHGLMPGVDAFIASARRARLPVWCLSNDVARWSAKLRTRFGLDRALAGAVISSEVGCRKPDAAIYCALLARCERRADEVSFIDDRPANVAAAAALGIRSHLFGAGGFAALAEPIFGANSANGARGGDL